MSDNVVSISARQPFARMTREELITELRKLAGLLNQYDLELQRIAKAVYPDDNGERPDDLENISGAEIEAGVKSLHELTDRVFKENDFLRAELLKRGYPGPAK